MIFDLLLSPSICLSSGPIGWVRIFSQCPTGGAGAWPGLGDKRAIKDSKAGFAQATHEHNVERDRFGKGEIAYRLNRQSS
jgi:hypothetical protein